MINNRTILKGIYEEGIFVIGYYITYCFQFM